MLERMSNDYFSLEQWAKDNDFEFTVLDYFDSSVEMYAGEVSDTLLFASPEMFCLSLSRTDMCFDKENQSDCLFEVVYSFNYTLHGGQEVKFFKIEAQVDGETLFEHVIVKGGEANGYVGSSEESAGEAIEDLYSLFLIYCSRIETEQTYEKDLDFRLGQQVLADALGRVSRSGSKVL